MSNLEPENNCGQNYYERELLYSIAISLKRIADVLTNDKDKYYDAGVAAMRKSATP